MSDPKDDPADVEVVGADANNLQDIDCTFPSRGLTVLVGVSGSGKTSLLRDVIASEALRRNVVFHGMPGKHLITPTPVRAFIGPVPPAIFVGQRGFRASSRSTVGTATGILALVRQLFLAEGRPQTVDGEAVPTPNPACYAEWIINHYRGDVTVWSVPLRWAHSDGRDAAKRLLAAGITEGILRSETDGTRRAEGGRRVNLVKWLPLRDNTLHALEAKVGAYSVKRPQDLQAVEALLANAWDISGRDVIVELHDAPEGFAPGRFGPMIDAAADLLHPNYQTIFRAPNRHLLTFNSPDHEQTGACAICRGIGRAQDIELDVLVSAPGKSMHFGAMALWTPKNYKHLNIQHETIEGLRGREGFDPDIAWEQLPVSAQRLILDGTGSEKIQGIDPATRKKFGAPRTFEGFRNAIIRRAQTAAGAAQLRAFVREMPCPMCAGSRWSTTARALQAAGRSLESWLGSPLSQVEALCRDAMQHTSTQEGYDALERLAGHALALTRLGLGHLSASRDMRSVSDGESRRLLIGSALAFSSSDRHLLLLDEPARGLHESDLQAMISVLRNLALHHCLLLNEHRDQLVEAADQILVLGPGAGMEGGRVIAAGPVSAPSTLPVLNSNVIAANHVWLRICGASIHNVQNQNVSLPLGALTAITGVSGSGKTSFARGILLPALLLAGSGVSSDAIDAAEMLQGSWTSIEGADRIRKVHFLHQRAPTRNRRSLVSTMTGAMQIIATAFAQTENACSAGFSAQDFSLNGGAGRCQTCLGTGCDSSEDLAPCRACGGSRYRHLALSATVCGLDIVQTLEQPVSTLLRHWAQHGNVELVAKLRPLISAMEELGLGHIAFGRRMDSLSGGESQRLRVALTLSAGNDCEGNFFFLDEPGAGLHAEDIRKLVSILRRLVDGGRNTVVVIEHNIHLIAAADWLVEFGPGSGPLGGEVLACGSPVTLSAGETPTGKVLAHEFGPLKQVAMPKLQMAMSLAISGVDPDDTSETIVQARSTSRSRSHFWEIGDLNLEVGKVILDEWDGQVASQRDHLLAQWKRVPDAKLVINPAIPEMRTWGSKLPRSIASALLDRAKDVGLSFCRDVSVDDIQQAPANLRAFLAYSGDADDARMQFLDHALGLGGGRTELTEASGTVIATLSTTPIDLDRAMIGPHLLTLAHLSRAQPEGQCRACRGEGVVRIPQLDLIIQSNERGYPLNAADILTPDALAILKGIWRENAKPFFRRMEREGLADPALYHQHLLFGFWHRPGHGTFAKSDGLDLAEVSSWLRWDGLLVHLWDTLHRSPSKSWAKAVEDSARLTGCGHCAGSGHTVAAHLLRLDGRSLADWAINGSVADLRHALEQMHLTRGRQKKTRDRLLQVLLTKKSFRSTSEDGDLLLSNIKKFFTR